MCKHLQPCLHTNNHSHKQCPGPSLTKCVKPTNLIHTAINNNYQLSILRLYKNYVEKQSKSAIIVRQRVLLFQYTQIGYFFERENSWHNWRIAMTYGTQYLCGDGLVMAVSDSFWLVIEHKHNRCRWTDVQWSLTGWGDKATSHRPH